MAIITSREFNQGSSKVLKVAETEPVYITKRGKITNVVLSYEQFQQYQAPEPQTKEMSFAEYFSGRNHPASDLPDEVFEIKRDDKDWNLRYEELFDE
ncbi:hypothetical protein B0187_07160 [Haemophilus paracuniculus]|uniref:Antitoxin n=1 Tax=Haemophilus paracuniculus TaxID=734 RepID=A0A1T0ARM0_9PAST|nr:type II toxin-antitoxin system Phd/YefM family antitoxin [Haemophilus paracuniculus]OOR99030.1 hypothetical protein B0187_07160 [Haemophilus paracuniculus]